MIAITARAFRYLSSEVRGLHAAAYVLAVCALLSSLLALFRDRMLAHTFGATLPLDLYYAGFRIPDFIFVALGALVSVYMLIPQLSERGEHEQRDYIDTIIVGFSLFAAFVSFIAWIAAPSILIFLFPHFFERGVGSELVSITRILLLQPILLGLSNILAAITQVRHRYALYAISPLLYNLGIIFGVLALFPKFGLAGMAWGVVLGALLHAAIQLPAILKDGFFHRLPRLYEPEALFRTVALSIPRSLALSLSQLTFLGLTMLAATISAGSIAIFMLAYNLATVPLSIIGASYSVAAFPTLALAYTRGDREEFSSLVATAARYVLFWSIPVAALIVVLRAHVVRVILGSGAFDWTDTRLTAAAFALFGLSLATQGLVLLLVRGYYAAGRTFVPLIFSLFTMLGTVTLAWLALGSLKQSAVLVFVEQFMRVENLGGSPVLALSFAFTAVSVIVALSLIVHFEYQFGGLLRPLGRAVLESCIAAIAGASAAYIVLTYVSEIDVSSTSLTIFLQGFAAGMLGFAVVAATYYALGSREYRETYASVRARLWRDEAKEDVTLVASAEE